MEVGHTVPSPASGVESKIPRLRLTGTQEKQISK